MQGQPAVMKVLSWNCRGLGKATAIRALKKLLQTHKPDVIFLMETKFTQADFQKRCKLSGDTFPNSFIVNCCISTSNRSGGLAMFWTNDVNLNIIAYNDRYIDCYVDGDNANIGWRATGLYGFSCHQQKPQTCDMIKTLFQNNSHVNWLLFGDFNMILSHSEKLGGNNINYSYSMMLQNCLNECDLLDLGYHGDCYTWSNNQDSTHHIKERLDRFCASPSWLSTFTRATNYHLPSYTSDHNPILLVFGSNFDYRNDSHRLNKIKRFEHIWLQDPQSHDIIRHAWITSYQDTKTKLQQAFEDINNWGQDTYGNIPRQIKKLQQSIHDKKKTIPTENDISMIQQMETNLDNLLKHEETWWAQRAKANWLHSGDKNTSFFHFKASQRKRKNNINFINDQNGIRATDNNNIQTIFMDYFTNLFTSSNPSNLSNSLTGVANRIKPHMYDHLNMTFTSQEVFTAVHQLKGNSAPGPDGLSAKFFQSYWETIGVDVTNTILDILNNGGSPEQFNTTFICLIPKNKQPTTPADFRPIALCNVMLKIITKTIANRIKQVLNELISPQQSAFLPGRLITDNTLIAFEAFHYLKHSKSKKHGYVGIKLDMAKAYDKIEWVFLQHTLTTMGFPPNLVDTIMRCVTTVSFSILVNGNPSPEFKPHRGIRQGDPLSPYLFIICADVLSSMITHLQASNKIKGITIATNAPLFLIFSLLMTAFYFAGLRRKRLIIS
jgi:exonuclease III